MKEVSAVLQHADGAVKDRANRQIIYDCAVSTPFARPLSWMLHQVVLAAGID